MEMEEGEDGEEPRMEHVREDEEGLTKNEESPRKTFSVAGEREGGGGGEGERVFLILFFKIIFSF